MAPPAAAAANRTLVFSLIVSMYTSSVTSCPSLLTSICCPRARSQTAWLMYLRASLILSAGTSRSQMIWKALANRASPARMAVGAPYPTWMVGMPLRTWSPSMRSSWISVKLWMYSTATASGTALDLSPPTAPQQATAMAGRILLPPA